MAVNSTPRPAGSADGYQWLSSPGAGRVSTFGSPPSNGICTSSPEAVAVFATTMLLSASQLLPPRLTPLECHSSTGLPPVRRTLFQTPSGDQYAIHWPSGEKNGWRAPVVPARPVASC